jgi:hypothetical protein
MASVRAPSIVVLLLTACGPSDRMTPVDDGSGGGGGGEANHCPDGTRTSLTGRVVAPNGIDPIPFAQVYIPRGALQPQPEGVSCESCSDLAIDALVRTTSAVDGTFSLAPLPTEAGQAPGREFDLVVQKGRFRGISKVVVDAPCADNTAPATATALPSRTEGANSIPKIAVATGAYDVMECVLLDLGLEPGSFDVYNGINLPFIGGTPGTLGNLPTLLGDLDRMKQYNIIFINCSENDFESQLGNEQVRRNLEEYVASGGRLYVTDWSYDYVEQVPEFSPVIDFAPGLSDARPEPRNAAAMGPGGVAIDATVEDDDLASWLRAVEEVTGEDIVAADGTVHIEHFLDDWAMQFDVAQAETSKVWMRGDAGSGLQGMRPLTTTFDYLECGRVLYSSYHTTGRDELSVIQPFPNYCSADGLAPQERVLLYLILHVADCIGPDVE